jgi:hypothetical protein
VGALRRAGVLYQRACAQRTLQFAAGAASVQALSVSTKLHMVVPSSWLVPCWKAPGTVVLHKPDHIGPWQALTCQLAGMQLLLHIMGRELADVCSCSLRQAGCVHRNRPHRTGYAQLHVEQHAHNSAYDTASHTLLPVTTPAVHISSCSHIQHHGFLL